jgi:class 3 adenylate cyclase/tetratricopeptide (TPR) repeat protein
MHRVTCGTCGASNAEGRKFCGQCGAPLARVCPSCGTPNPPQDKYCGECGSGLDTATPPDAPAPPPPTATVDVLATERRLVSVLFLDLVGFTTISEQHDAEEMRSLLSAYFETARTIIERHGGAVEKFIGDAVMAVWGTPVAHEDDAERAVRTALELVDAVQALGRSEGVPLQARGGVLTGEAATMPGAVAEGMVTGDMVNTASRLQSAAEPGSVFVGEATFRATSRAIAFDDVGELSLKGKDAPVRAWRALRVVAELGGANRMTIEPPFVGRAEELRLLKDLLHATGREGKARLVSITGIGGIGKSRLVWELEKYTDGLTDTIYWHQGRCPSYGEGITFWALGEMVRMRAGIAETDLPAQARGKLDQALQRWIPDAEERSWAEPRLRFLLALIDERPTGGRDELFAAWRLLFERISEESTTVLVFEDIQWADAGLLDFIESMLEWSRARPILIVTLARPELTDRRPDWGAKQRSFIAIHLERLPDDAIGELVTGLVLGAPDDAVAAIVGRAEGVPLYAVETLRMLADRGALRAGEGVYELAGPLTDLQVPETLQALIASRLDALDPGDRRLVQDASVLGQSFTSGALAALADQPQEAIEDRLRELVRREILRSDADPRSPERGQWAFTQGLLREVAHGMLAKSERRTRHLAAAHHFEGLDDPELASVVAAHYVEALNSTPAGPDAEALGARARDWLAQAADRATALGSPDQALSLIQQALAIDPPRGERRSLLWQASEAAHDALRNDEYRSALLEVADLAHEDDDAVGEARALGRLTRRIGIEDPAVAALLVARLRGLAEHPDPRVQAEVAHGTGVNAFFEGDYEGALRSIEAALTSWESLDDEEMLLVAIMHKVTLLGAVGRHREATMLMRGYTEEVRRSGDLRAIARALFTAGVVYIADDPRAALEASVESAEVSRRSGHWSEELEVLGNGVESAIDLGDWGTAQEMLARLGELSSAQRELLVLNQALLAAYRGETDETIDEVLAMAPHANPMMRAWEQRVRAVVATNRGDADAGYAAAMAAIEIAPSGMNSPAALWAAGHAALWDPIDGATTVARLRTAIDLTSSHRGAWIANVRRSLEAAIAGIEGRDEDAAAAYAESLRTWRSLQLPFDHAMTVADAVSVVDAAILPDGAVDDARAFLQRIGAGPLLSRLDRAIIGGTADIEA